MASSKRGVPGWVFALAGVVALGAVAFVVWQTQQLPSGVVPVAWDKAACAHCRMMVSERPFAAQLQLKDGRVLDFDDPGCLFEWWDEARPAPELHAGYFHHLREDRWLSLEEVAFVEVSPTPMGFGVGAVPRDTAGALSLDETRARLRAKRAGGSQP